MRASLFLFRGRLPLGLDVARDIAAGHGGTCLSTEYKRIRAHLRWRCQHGHTWNASLYSLKFRRSWCPFCARNAPLSLEAARDAATSRGGRCLSPQYVNSRVPMHWQCHVGHEWQATLHSVRNHGTWCPQCARNMRLNLGIADSVAKSRGGMCLSKDYTNTSTLMHWQCAEGHRWLAILTSVKDNGTWCPTCATVARRLGICVANEVAAARGGTCLSLQYFNVGEPLQWRCSEGHEWSASLRNVKYGNTWCPVCASGRSERDIRMIFETIFSDHAFPTKRPKFLQSLGGGRLELDGYCAKLSLAFEYNGEQHYKPTHYFNRHSDNRFEMQRARDRRKVSICSLIGIRLVVVPHCVKDRWSFVRISLLQWFPLGVIFPTQLPPTWKCEEE